MKSSSGATWTLTLSAQRKKIRFVPLVAERSGGWSSTAQSTFKSIAKIAAAKKGIDSGVLCCQLLERLCVAIRRAQARSVLKRGCADDGDGAPRGSTLGDQMAW